MIYPFDLHLSCGERERYASVKNKVDLYKEVEYLRLDHAVKSKCKGEGSIMLHLDGYDPVELVVEYMEMSMNANGYGVDRVERILQDALHAQGMFRHLSTEPHDFTTIWEELI